MKHYSIQEMSDLYKVLANERRLAILKYLSSGRSKNVQTIAKVIDLSPHATSKHLQRLHQKNFLGRSRKGLDVFYRIAKDKHPILRSTLKLFL